MDHFGMLVVCNSNNSIWYYFPSLNRKTFNKEQDIPMSFKPSSILCFQFDGKGQLPIFLFYALVSKCNKIEGWDILVEDKKKCIYEKTACFSYRDLIVIVCICKFQIQVQVFFPPDYDNERIGPILVEIQTTMEWNIRQFKQYTYEIGYKCQNGELLCEKDNSFIALDDFPTDRLLCSRCVVSKKHIVENAICWVILIITISNLTVGFFSRLYFQIILIFFYRCWEADHQIIRVILCYIWVFPLALGSHDFWRHNEKNADKDNTIFARYILNSIHIWKVV